MRGIKALVLCLLVVFALLVTGCGLLPGGDDGADDGTSGGGGTSGSGVAKVTLSWDEPVDMDLEIWDNAGENAMFAASSYGGEDVQDGSADEFFEFKQYGEEDFSAGKYVVSVFYAGRPDDSNVDSVGVTLTVEMPDGSTDVRSGTVFWETGQDQWHAFRIDAATGAIEDIDQLVEIEVTE